MSRLVRDATYILPLKWADDGGLDELAAYLERLAGWLTVIVVDGSEPALFEAHARRFPAAVRHVRPHRQAAGAEGGKGQAGGNGKVGGVLTGLELAESENLVIADDDVRYDLPALTSVLRLLDRAELVRPQNYFLSLPWHARWDTARTLVNRAISSDYPGTLAVRRSALMATGGYDGGVLFENLELIRTIKAAGGREVRANGVYVGRIPPAARHFLRQRVRQAYDDFAQPLRLAAELSLLPLMLGAARLGATGRSGAASRPGGTARSGSAALLAGLAACTVGVAEVGRRRHGGTAFFPADAALWAPLWVVERSVCIWAALALRLAGGVPYAGSRLAVAAHSPAELRRRHQGKIRQQPSKQPSQEDRHVTGTASTLNTR
jgi:hypothetical protein